MQADFSAYHFNLPLLKPYPLSFGAVKSYDTFYVVMEADGMIGLGEITPLPGYSHETPASVESDLVSLAHAFAGGAHFRSILMKKLSTAPFLVSGIVCACETLLEGARKAFLSPVENPVPLAAFCRSDTPQDAASAARDLVAQGYTTLKVKVGVHPVHQEAEAIRAIAAEISKGCMIRLDANQAYNLEQASTLCSEIEDIDAVELLEQPFGPSEWQSHEKLVSSVRVPIMLDESIWNEDDIRRASDCGAKLVKLKLCKHPGMEGSMRLGKMALGLGLNLVYGNGVQTALGNHLEARVYRELDLHTASESNGFLKIGGFPISHGLSVTKGTLVDRGLKSVDVSFDSERRICQSRVTVDERGFSQGE